LKPPCTVLDSQDGTVLDHADSYDHGRLKSTRWIWAIPAIRAKLMELGATSMRSILDRARRGAEHRCRGHVHDGTVHPAIG
jgi:hypothetical protein